MLKWSNKGMKENRISEMERLKRRRNVAKAAAGIFASAIIAGGGRSL